MQAPRSSTASFLDRYDLRRRAILVLAGAFIVGALLVPLSIFVPLYDTSTQRGLLATTEELCAILGEDAAVVILDDGTPFPEATYSQAIRGVCEVPVAIATPSVTYEDLVGLAQEWRDEGRTLWLLTGGDQPEDLPLELDVIVQTEFRFLERTIERRPSGWERGDLTVRGAPIPP